jgi:hypothetical protein
MWIVFAILILSSKRALSGTCCDMSYKVSNQLDDNQLSIVIFFSEGAPFALPII